MGGYWTVVHDGIYYVVAAPHVDQVTANRVKFFDFAKRRTIDAGVLAGPLEEWVGGWTLSRDRRTVVYSHRTYNSSEIMLIDSFR